MLDFYYDFSVDVEKRSLLIGVDQKYQFEMIYPENCNFEPKVFSQEDGSYRLELKNIFKKIDIIFLLKSSEIKEEIKVWDKSAAKDFSLSFNLKNCLLFYDESENKYKIVGKNQIEIFSFSSLKINYENHNKNTNLDNFCKLEVLDGERRINYKFSSKSYDSRYFPISIDPTFNFKVQVRKSSGYINTGFDRSNYMVVTGKTIANEFFDSAVGLASNRTIIGSTIEHKTPYSPPGEEYYKKILSSDDIIFERECRLMFPYLTDLIEQVNVSVNQEGIETVIGALPIQSVFVNDIRYDYVDFSFKFNLPSRVKIDALVSLDRVRYGTFSILYTRNLTFLPETNIKLDNGKNFITRNIDTDKDEFSSSYLVCSSADVFKPKKINLIPFSLNFVKAPDGSSVEEIKNSSYRQKDKTLNFNVDTNKTESASQGLVNYYFDFPNYSINTWPPVRNIVQNNSSECIMERGVSQSFRNEAEIIYVSGINNRSNIQENIEFKKPYTYIDPNDFYFNIDAEEATVSSGKISLNTNNFKLFFYQKSSHYIKIKDNNKIKDINNFSVTYLRESNETVLDASFFGDFFVYQFGTGNPFVRHSINVSFIDTERLDESTDLNDIDTNALSGQYAVIRVGNKIFNYKIKKSTSTSLTFFGNIKNSLDNSDYLGVFPYLPDEVTFVYDHIKYDVKRTKAFRYAILESTGDLSYKPVDLEVLGNAPSEIIANFRERGEDFGGISKKVSIRDESLFYFFGFDIGTVKVNAYIESGSNTNFSSLIPNKIAISSGGIIFNSFSVPQKYSKKILYLNIDSPGFADKVVLDIYDKNGIVTEYTGNVDEVLEFITESSTLNRFLEIRINQSNLDYSKIVIKFKNI